jgi:signal transduction histidine kinase
MNDRPRGTEHIATVQCGTHLCEFHNTDEELIDTLVPYFADGLQQDEFCVWITSDPMGVGGAKARLRNAASNLQRYVDLGQIEVWDCRDWYLRGGHFDADRVFGMWAEKEKWALDSGYKGLRVSGDMAWLEKQDWPNFMAYEAEANRIFPQHRMIGLCTYPLDDCRADAALEVIRNHHFTVARVTGEWQMIESSSINTAKGDPLQQLSADILEQQDDERRWIANQLHEVTAQNVSAITILLANMQQRRWLPSAVRFLLAKCHTLCEQSLEQILTLSRLLHPLILDELGLAVALRRYVEDFTKQSRIHVELETEPGIGRLPLQMETHLFRIAQEALSNIVRYSGSLKAIVRLHREADDLILQIEDFGRGMPTVATEGDVAKRQLGILRMQQRLLKIGGHFEIRSSNQGTLLTASVRFST